MSEKFKAEFTTFPVVIAFAPGILFFSLMTGAATGNLWAGILIAGLPLSLLMGLVIVMIKKSQAIVYSDAFEYSSSFLSKSVKRIEASKIESVDFRESIIGKSGWGSVTVRGAGIRALMLKNVRNPEQLASALRSVASSPVPKSGKSDPSNLVSNIGDLKRLFDEGVITQEEFEKAKAKIISN